MIRDRGRTPEFNPLDSVILRDPGQQLGRFWGDATKWLNVKLDDQGAVLYGCTKSKRRRRKEKEEERQRQGRSSGVSAAAAGAGWRALTALGTRRPAECEAANVWATSGQTSPC